MTATRMQISVSEHVFSTTAPLVFALGDTRSLQVHLISEFVSAPLLTALLINGEVTRPYFHYAPNDLDGEGSLQLLPFYFRQCAVARDAAARGLTVLLVEKNDLASGTSGRSTKLLRANGGKGRSVFATASLRTAEGARATPIGKGAGMVWCEGPLHCPGCWQSLHSSCRCPPV